MIFITIMDSSCIYLSLSLSLSLYIYMKQIFPQNKNSVPLHDIHTHALIAYTIYAHYIHIHNMYLQNGPPRFMVRLVKTGRVHRLAGSEIQTDGVMKPKECSLTDFRLRLVIFESFLLEEWRVHGV